MIDIVSQWRKKTRGSTPLFFFIRKEVRSVKELYQVGELANFFGVSSDTIRLYDRMGIIRSERGDNNYRHFSRADLIALCYVITLREADLPLSDIHHMLNEGDVINSMDQLVKWRNVVMERIADLNSCKSRIDDYLRNFQKAGFHLNTIRYERNAAILMHPLSADKDTMFDSIHHFERLTRQKTTVLSFLVESKFLNTEQLKNFQYIKRLFPMVLSMIDEPGFVDGGEADISAFQVYRYPLCAVGIVSARASKDYSRIVEMYERIADMHTIVGEGMLRVISVRNSVDKDLDFYEFWIPIQPD